MPKPPHAAPHHKSLPVSSHVLHLPIPAPSTSLAIRGAPKPPERGQPLPPLAEPPREARWPHACGTAEQGRADTSPAGSGLAMRSGTPPAYKWPSGA